MERPSGRWVTILVIDRHRVLQIRTRGDGVWLAWWEYGRPHLIHGQHTSETITEFDTYRRRRTAERTQRLRRRRSPGRGGH